MSAESNFLRAERENTEKSLVLLEDLLQKEALSPYEIIAMGTLLQNVYMGIERILRGRLKLLGENISKGESWHKDLLRKAHEHALITEEQHRVFYQLLGFRHVHVHGYGHMLDEIRVRELALSALTICREYLRSQA